MNPYLDTNAAFTNTAKLFDPGAAVANAVRNLYVGDGVGILKFSVARAADYANDFLSSVQLKPILLETAVVVSAACVAVLAYVAVQRRILHAATPAPESGQPQPEMPTKARAAAALRSRWNEVMAHLDSVNESDWKLAVLEADKVVDAALGRAGFSGDTFGDRLTAVEPGTLQSLDGLWWAHRVRNRVAHEMDYFLRYTEARQAMSYYEATLAELKLL